MASLNILFEVRPYIPGAGRSTIRLASSSADATGTQLDGLQWEPLIVSGPEYSFKYTSEQNGQLVEGSADMGTIQFRMGDFYDNEIWTTYDWNNASCRVWVGELGSPFASYRKLFEATTSGIERDGVTATVALRSLTGRLNRPLLDAVYAGTGGAEGPVGMKGAVKPFAIGNCLSVEPVVVDAAEWIYQVHGYGPVQDISAVYDFAQPLVAPIASVGTYNELAALTLKPGEWAKCNALGMFRLGGASDKKITADVQGGIFYGQYPDTVADIVPALLRKADFAPSQIGSFAALANKGWSFYSKEPADVGTVCRKAVLDAGGYLISDNQGVWQVGNAFAPKAAKPLLADGSAEPSVGAILERNVADPLWQVEVGYDPCWGVHSASDISPKLLELAGSIAEQDAALKQVKETADLAKATAEAAEIEIDNMGADGILDRSEKIDNQRLLEEAAAERSAIASKIGIYNAATEWNAYVAAHEALKTYLAPLLADITVNSPIDRAAFKGRWATYKEKHQAVWNAMAGDARTVSTWAGTSGAGKPQDNATVGGEIGKNIYAPGTATVLAPDQIITAQGTSANTAKVGTRSATQVVNDIESASGAIAAEVLRGSTYRGETDQLIYMPDGTPVRRYAESLGVKTNDHEAYIAFLREVSGDGTAKFLLSATADGKIVGIQGVAGNGTANQLSFVASRFLFVDDSGNNPANALLYEGGVWKLNNIEVDRIKAKSVTIENIAPGLSAAPRFTAPDTAITTGETVVIETPAFMVGSFGEAGSALALISFAQDGSATVDTAATIRVYVDTGSGYAIQKNRVSGLRTKDGDTRWIMQVSIPISISSASSARIKVTAEPYSLADRRPTTTDGSYARDIAIDLLRVGR